MTESDVEAAKKYFDDDIMALFGYHHPVRSRL
jgi:hypothetical protein